MFFSGASQGKLLHISGIYKGGLFSQSKSFMAILKMNLVPTEAKVEMRLIN